MNYKIKYTAIQSINFVIKQHFRLIQSNWYKGVIHGEWQGDCLFKVDSLIQAPYNRGITKK